MTTYSQRLRTALGATTSITQLAKAIGVSYQAVKKILDGGSSSFSAANNAKAAAFLSVSPDWLATGEGEMRPVEAITRETGNIDYAIKTIAASLAKMPDASRNNAAVLLQGLARDPDGPWSAWLTDLLGNKAVTAAGIVTTTPSLKQVYARKAQLPSDTDNMGDFDASAPKNDRYKPSRVQKPGHRGAA